MKNRIALLPLLSVCLVLLFGLSLVYGAVSIPLREVIDILCGKGSSSPAWEHIVWQARLPQAVTALFAGADNLTMMTISVSAVLAGAVCGDHISPISDTTVMSSAGAQSNHINHVSTQMQYAAVVATVSFVGYILAGIIRVWWIVLGISLILLIGVLMGMRMFLERKQVKKHAG